MNFDFLFEFYQRHRPLQLVIIENPYDGDSFNVLRGGRIFLKDIPNRYADAVLECIANKRIPNWLIYTWTRSGTGWHCDPSLPVQVQENLMRGAAPDSQ
jgi:hypothetical protein